MSDYGDYIDLSQPTDIVKLVAFYGTDIGGADYLQPDGSWKRHGYATAARFPRPEAVNLAESLKFTVSGKGIRLWLASRASDPVAP